MAEVIIRSINENLTQEITAGENLEHRFLSDEPSVLGGKNQGPTPYDLLLAALGSCTAITLFMYAKRKNWKLSAVRIKLKHDRIHAKDCADCESNNGFIHYIFRDIELEGSLDETQRQRLLVIAEHCPVHKTLMNEIIIRDSLI
ncbi:MAG TPA: osmotically inducible protein C [Bdellovibrionales bacterium]|nr:MAG: osmotically inducible protein C [Bdellovibrionales bacterium GWB1_52_6]OFZ05867.1 MAG: osmotically inducible protein C [Bdellovibrionales bacterium GWA1_52_35]OFZ33326.1 MAG: osmotically inducible protein C [Bdellovibrionales bacterium GWC1_52_8]HAR41291.1 osmotically inducible protein C [Bdellovibrionales bacterium]HCM39757.1 osmotically inducible protein C [Bdellovibrionales bacterium]